MKRVFLPVALADIEDIYVWNCGRNLARAKEIEDALFSECDFLTSHPELGAKTDTADVRRWPMPDFRYTIFYRIDRTQEVIKILRIRDGRQVRNVMRVPV